MGVNITHIDSHQHTHVLPGVNKLVIKLCCEYNIKGCVYQKGALFFIVVVLLPV